ncbi:MAG: response regulator [Chloroflexi bacterium]|nr:response regulator [Chloroflexota bacterium]
MTTPNVDQRGIIPRPKSLVSARQPLIVHVDDTPAVLMVARYAVESRTSGRYVSFTDGAAALNFMHLRRPSILMTDINRPGMDGLTLVKLLRIDPLLTDVPVLFVTARSDMQDEVITRFKAAVLPKPFTIDSLTTSLLRLLAELETPQLA